jgi:hypothetical protein
MEKDGQLQQEFGSIDLLEPEGGCTALNLVQMDVIFPGLSKLAQYPLRWLPLAGAAVLKDALGAQSASNTRYSELKRTLPNASIVVQLTLAPDVWTSHNKDAGHTNVASLHALLHDGTLYNFAAEGQALPMAFISQSTGPQGWAYHEDIQQLLTAQRCPFKGLFDKKRCQASPYSPPELVPLPLPESPLLAELVAGSSGSTGFAGSPSVYGRIAAKFEDYIIHGKFDSAICNFVPDLLRPLCSAACKASIVTKPLWDKVIDCWPYGAQVLAPPMVRDGADVSSAEEEPAFRYMDGGYAENTALPMTLAQAQRDCYAGRLDCQQPVRIMLVNDGNVSSDHTGPGCCRARDPLRSLFADDAAPVGSFVSGMFDSVRVPSQTIFAEKFPERHEWTEYLRFPSQRKVHPLDPLSKEWVQEDIVSLYWSGTLTTVENPHFGVKAGQIVELLVFSLEIPGIIFPGLFDENSQLISPGHLRIADGAVMQQPDLIAGHAPMAKAQAEAMAPVLQQFLLSGETQFV